MTNTSAATLNSSLHLFWVLFLLWIVFSVLGSPGWVARDSQFARVAEKIKKIIGWGLLILYSVTALTTFVSLMDIERDKGESVLEIGFISILWPIFSLAGPIVSLDEVVIGEDQLIISSRG